MKKLIILLTALLLVFLIGYDEIQELNMPTITYGDDCRFCWVEKSFVSGGYRYTIGYDKETMVMYVCGRYGDFSPLYNPDGTLCVYEEG